MAHVPPPAEWRDKMKWQQVTSHDHFTWSPTTISDSRITYHDLCQTARRVMMALPPPSVIMTTQNISPPLKKNQSFWYYIYQPSHKEEGKLAIPSKRPTDLSPSLWPWLTKPSKGASGHPIWTPFAGGTTESRICIGWDRASIHLATTWITRDAKPQQRWGRKWNVKNLRPLHWR